MTIDGVADDGAAADVSGTRRDNVGTLIERVLGSGSTTP